MSYGLWAMGYGLWAMSYGQSQTELGSRVIHQKRPAAPAQHLAQGPQPL